jgi:resuscitation-promoting factor RpfA
VKNLGKVHRARAGATAVVAAGGGGLTCWALVVLVTSSWTALHQPAPLPDDVVALLAGAAGTLLCGWWTLAAALTALAALVHDGMDGAGRLARTARAVTPGALRRAVALSVGVSLVAGGTAARAAVGVHAPAERRPTAVATGPAAVALADPLDPGWGAVAPGRPAARPATVLVRPGDTLWALAGRRLRSPLPAPGRTAVQTRARAATDAQIAKAWPGWFAANRTVIGADPDHIEPGQRLVPPT